MVSVPCYRCNRYHRIVPLANMLVISRVVLSYRYKQFKIETMKIEKAIFVNRAPFQKVEFDFLESGVNVLSGINGRGKTTVISHIVDVFYEMARSSFSNSFEGKENKFYRYSSILR